MPIAIQHDSPPYNLGDARFIGASPAGSNRLFSVAAEKLTRCKRPINLCITTDEHRSSFNVSIDEAEALIACLAHAVELRRAVEAQKAA